MQKLIELCKKSNTEKKGVTFYVGGAQVSAVVTHVGDGFIEGRNQTHDHIVVMLDRVCAAAMA